MKKLLLLTAAASFLLTHAAFADQTIVYPNQDKAEFSVSAPDDWEFNAGKEAEDYCTLTKGDIILYFRSVEGDEAKITDVVKETFEYVKETYPDAATPEPKDDTIDGKKALTAGGSGKDKEGVETNFGFAWVDLGGDKIAEVWYEAAAADKENAEEAIKILSSFKVHAK